MTELTQMIAQRAERGDVLNIRSQAFIPLDKEAVWTGRKLDPNAEAHKQGVLRLVSARSNSSAVESDGQSVPLDKMIAARPDLFIHAKSSDGTLPFEISRVLTGRWDAQGLLTVLNIVRSHTSREDVHEELVGKTLSVVERGNHDQIYDGAMKAYSLVKGLKREHYVSSKVFDMVTAGMEGFLDGGMAVRINYRDLDSDPDNTLIMVQKAVRGAGLYLGLKEHILHSDWEGLKTGGMSMKQLLHFDTVAPGQCRTIPSGIPYGASGDLELVMIEGYPRKPAFIYDWGHQSFLRLMKRARERAEQVEQTPPTPTEERGQFKFRVPAGKKQGVIQRHAGSYEMTRVSFGANEDFQWTVEMGDRAAYVIGLSGWVTVRSLANSVRLSNYDAAFIPPRAGSLPNVFSIAGSSGLLSQALIVRPL